MTSTINNSLTAHLLSTTQEKSSSAASYAAATRSPFLTKAGSGTLAADSVCEWLVQDKYYQLGYVNFIGGLLSKLDLFSSPFLVSPNNDDAGNNNKKGEDNLLRTTMHILIDSLIAIRSEIDFYDRVVEQCGLELKYEGGMNGVTREYVELFREVSSVRMGKWDDERGILDGLLVLWATEHCYLTAWTHASSQARDPTDTDSQGQQTPTNAAIAALQREFIPNWTSEEFSAFVDKLARVTDAWAAGLGKEEREGCESLWMRVLDLETRFWPEV